MEGPQRLPRDQPGAERAQTAYARLLPNDVVAQPRYRYTRGMYRLLFTAMRLSGYVK